MARKVVTTTIRYEAVGSGWKEVSKSVRTVEEAISKTEKAATKASTEVEALRARKAERLAAARRALEARAEEHRERLAAVRRMLREEAAAREAQAQRAARLERRTAAIVQRLQRERLTTERQAAQVSAQLEQQRARHAVRAVRAAAREAAKAERERAAAVARAEREEARRRLALERQRAATVRAVSREIERLQRAEAKRRVQAEREALAAMKRSLRERIDAQAKVLASTRQRLRQAAALERQQARRVEAIDRRLGGARKQIAREVLAARRSTARISVQLERQRARHSVQVARALERERARQARQAAREVEAARRREARAADAAAAATQRLRRDVARFVVTFARARIAHGIINMIGRAARRAAQYFRELVEAGERFVWNVAKVSTIADPAVHSVEGLAAAVRRLAVAYGTDTQTQTQAFYETLTRGIRSGSDATRVMVAANKLAIGGASDLRDSVMALTKILHAYNLETTDAAMIVEKIFRGAVMAAVTDVGDFARALGHVAGVASKVGISIDELFAAVAVASRILKDTNQAARSLATGLLRMTDPTGKAQREARALGIVINESALRVRGLLGVLRSMIDAGKATAATLARITGGVRGGKAMIALATGDARRFAEAIEAMGAEADRANEAVARMTENAAFGVRRLRAAFDVTSGAIGEAIIKSRSFQGAMRGLQDVMGAALDAVRGFGGGVEDSFERSRRGMRAFGMAALVILGQVARVADLVFKGFAGVAKLIAFARAHLHAVALTSQFADLDRAMAKVNVTTAEGRERYRQLREQKLLMQRQINEEVIALQKGIDAQREAMERFEQVTEVMLSRLAEGATLEKALAAAMRETSEVSLERTEEERRAAEERVQAAGRQAVGVREHLWKAASAALDLARRLEGLGEAGAAGAGELRRQAELARQALVGLGRATGAATVKAVEDAEIVAREIERVTEQQATAYKRLAEQRAQAAARAARELERMNERLDAAMSRLERHFERLNDRMDAAVLRLQRELQREAQAYVRERARGIETEVRGIARVQRALDRLARSYPSLAEKIERLRSALSLQMEARIDVAFDELLKKAPEGVENVERLREEIERLREATKRRFGLLPTEGEEDAKSLGVAVDRMTQKMQQARQVARSVGGAIAGLVRTAVTDMASLGSAVLGLVASIGEELLGQLIAKLIEIAIVDKLFSAAKIVNAAAAGGATAAASVGFLGPGAVAYGLATSAAIESTFLPQLALPMAQAGGTVAKTGAAVVHEGEVIVPAEDVRTLFSDLSRRGPPSVTIVQNQMVPGDRVEWRRTVRDVILPELRALGAI